MKLLVVDDNQFIIEVIRKMLEGQGHEITSANSVDDAVEHLESGEGCDLVVTDIVMPEKDGIKLARYVKAKTPEIPVLAITGGLENALEDYAILGEMFADEVLTKPLNKASFIETINRLAA